jgi:uncharacterized protein (DUF1800 family)
VRPTGPAQEKSSARGANRKIIALLLIFPLAFSSSFGLVQDAKGQKRKADQGSARGGDTQRLSEEQRVVHLLDRATFGARPNDVERVMKLGWEKFLDEQLHPDRIADQAAEQRLKNIESVHLSNAELARNYPPPQVLKEVLKERGIELPGQAGAGANANQNQEQGTVSGNVTKKEAKKEFKKLGKDAGRKNADVMDEPPQAISKPDSGNATQDRALQANDNDPAKRREAYEALRQMGYKPQQQVVQESQQAKILRAIYSERQLQEVMTDFWFNHFNIYIQKGPDRILTTSFEREAIRPNVFGKFEDLLKATAEHPAMLFYLDNWMSASPNAKTPNRDDLRQMRRERRLGGVGIGGRPGNLGVRYPRMNIPIARDNQPAPVQNRPPAKRARGLNENYAREIMELHTLGVNGGYTQKDVQEVARCLTGWTIRAPRAGGEFYFNPLMHDDGEKTVLGKKISAGGGIKDGYAVIHLLATHPSTAKFISTKLARKFVSDEPPQSLVDRLSQTFLKTDGDIREMLRTLFTSPEFFAPENYRAKIKTPFEMTVSAARAIGAETNGNPQFHRWLAQMGEGLFLCQPPTGYPDMAEHWVNSGALLERMNFALALSGNRIPGTRVNLENLSAGPSMSQPSQVVDHFIRLLLRGQVSPQTRATIDKSLAERQSPPDGSRTRGPSNGGAASSGDAMDVAKVVGLILGSPEFQRQ